ncbi:hypothetical protein CPB83DRAFT_855838 [Crepidotus variabilis]|uniref:Uncharacterized protein n=1 Tax=Crepidotus variabilis TaxID=179855 RepID=A0A9P6EF96_9AGAR|nr:hypothetical protein CPB83DRAFT_855838 [Crepidotus variabilis]
MLMIIVHQPLTSYMFLSSLSFFLSKLYILYLFSLRPPPSFLLSSISILQGLASLLIPSPLNSSFELESHRRRRYTSIHINIKL